MVATLTLQDISASIAAMQQEQTELAAALEHLQQQVDESPTNDQAMEHARITLRLNAIPGQLARLQAQRTELEIQDLKARLAASDAPFNAAADELKTAVRNHVELKWEMTVRDELQSWLYQTLRAPLETLYREKVQCIDRLIALGVMTQADQQALRDRMDAVRSYAGDRRSELVYQRIYAAIEQEVLERYGLTVAASEKQKHYGWGKPFPERW